MTAREEMTQAEIEEYLAANAEYDGRGERPDGDYDDGDGEREQVMSE